MKEILTELNKSGGVRGSLISTADGIVVACELEMGLREEMLAAVSSSLTTLTRKVFNHLELGDFQRVVLGFSRGRIIVVQAGRTCLIVVTRREANLGLVLIDIEGAVLKIRKQEQFEG